MGTRLAVIALLAAAGTGVTSPLMCRPAAAQTPDFVLVHQRTEDLFPVVLRRYSNAAQMVAGVQYFIGTNPMGVAYDGQSLYLSGYMNAFSTNTTSANSPFPMARDFNNVATNYGGGVINPITGRVVVGGEALTEVIPRGDDEYPLGLFWSHGLVKITLNANGTSTYYSDKFMRTNFIDATSGPNGTGFITAENPRGIISMGYPMSWGTALDFAPGVGLLATFETNTGVVAPSKVRWYDTATAGAPILRTPNAENQVAGDAHIIGGAAWDFGADGTGFDYRSGSGTSLTFTPDGVKDGPLAAVMVQPSSPSPTQYGAVGIDKERLNPHFTDSELVAGTAAVIYHAGYPGDGFPALPALNFGPRITASPNRTLWSDVSIHPRTGTVIARASNDLIYSYRSTDGSADAARTGRILSEADMAFNIGQKCGIVYDVPGVPDLAVWNDLMVGGGQPLTTLIRFSKLDGVVPPADATAAVVQETVDPVTGVVTRTPFAVTIGGQIADVHYDAGSRTLVVLDFNDYYAYLFRVEAATPVGPTCLADVTLDGTVDGSDFIAFINSFGVGDATIDPTADVIADGTIDGTDFIEFINAFAAGC